MTNLRMLKLDNNSLGQLGSRDSTESLWATLDALPQLKYLTLTGNSSLNLLERGSAEKIGGGGAGLAGPMAGLAGLAGLEAKGITIHI